MKFVKPRQSNGQLAFVIDDGGATPTITLTGRTRTPLAKSEGQLAVRVRLSGIVVTDSEVTTRGSLAYDINVDRGPKLNTRSNFAKGTRLSVVVVSGFGQHDPLRQRVNVRHLFASELFNTLSTAWLKSGVLGARSSTCFQDATKVDNHFQSGWHSSDTLALSVSSRHEDATKVNNHFQSWWRNPGAVYSDINHSYQDAVKIDLTFNDAFGVGDTISKVRTQYYQDAVPPKWVKIDDPIDPVDPPIIIPPPKLDFRQLRQNDARLRFVYIELEALIVMNEIKFYNVSESEVKTPFHPSSPSIRLDIDSYSWVLTGVVEGSHQLDFVKPGEMIEVSVNGYVWRFVAQTYSRDRESMFESYNFTADSATRFLGDPYAPKVSDAVSVVISPWQLAEQRITPLGFELDRTAMLDWTLEADSYSYSQLTPIQLLAEVAKASGGVIKPDPVDSKLVVTPRYKHSSWLWSSLTDDGFDHVIPDEYITKESSADQSKPSYNSLLVSGETHGVITEVVMGGTAGDVSAPEVVSELSQSNQVNVELGRNTFSEAGRQQVVTLQTPLLPDGFDYTFGLLRPGELVKAGDMIGLVIDSSVSINELDDVWQNFTLEVHNDGDN